MTTLKDIKATYPDKVTTCGRVYYIEGFGYFYMKKGQLFEQGDDGMWWTSNMDRLAHQVQKIFG